MKILVTGSSGHLASFVTPKLVERGHVVFPYDLPDGDVRDFTALYKQSQMVDVCVHLAGLKYATSAESSPLPTVDVNVNGTANVVSAFHDRVVLASTCKAADPETVYGCSKLIAERLVLGAGGRVCRLVNVLGSPGSVTDIWNAIPEADPIPVCKARRMFIGPDEAASLICDAILWPVGRYAPENPRLRTMDQIAEEVHPGRPTIEIPLRRGDRQDERLFSNCEQPAEWTGAMKIVNQHDSEEAKSGRLRV